MSDPSVLAAAFVTVIVAVAAAVVSVINARAAAARVEIKTDSLLKQTAEIHSATNGQLSLANKQIAVANEKIEGLERMISTLAADKLVAQAKPEAGDSHDGP